jgi:hypothetical protein
LNIVTGLGHYLRTCYLVGRTLLSGWYDSVIWLVGLCYLTGRTLLSGWYDSEGNRPAVRGLLFERWQIVLLLQHGGRRSADKVEGLLLER